jgi:hypothetical protein
MSAVASPRPAVSGRPLDIRVTQAHVVRSEWTKLRSLRSTRVALAAAVFVAIAAPLIASAFINSNWTTLSAQDRASFNPLDTSLIGILFAQLAIGALGVLTITGEYTTGMIRSTFSAVPRRLPVLWAKAGVFGVVALVLAVPSALIAFFGSQAILSGQNISIGFGHAGVARAVIGAGLYLTLVGLFGLALGAIVRNSAGGISALAGVLFVLPPLLSVLPSSWDNAISPYLPSNAGQAVMTITPDSNTLGPWVGLALFAAYTAAAIAVAAVLLRRRDV